MRRPLFAGTSSPEVHALTPADAPLSHGASVVAAASAAAASAATEAASVAAEALVAALASNNTTEVAPSMTAPIKNEGRVPTVVGITLVVIGTISVSCGFHCWNLSKATEGKQPCCCGKPLWWLGAICIAVIPTTVDSLSYSLLPLSEIAAFGALPIVWNAIICHFGWIGSEKEKVGIIDLCCFAAIMGGVILVSFTTVEAPHVRKFLSDYQEEISEPGFIAFGSVVFTGSLLWFLMHAWPWLRSTIQLDMWPEACPMLLTALLTAMAAAVTQTFVKLISETIREFVEGASLAQLASEPTPWIGIFGGIIFAGQNFIVMQLFFGRDRAVSLSLPAYQGLVIIFTTIAGVAFLHELKFSPGWGVGLFVTGVAIILLGLAPLAIHQQKMMSQRKQASIEKESAGSDATLSSEKKQEEQERRAKAGI